MRLGFSWATPEEEKTLVRSSTVSRELRNLMRSPSSDQQTQPFEFFGRAVFNHLLPFRQFQWSSENKRGGRAVLVIGFFGRDYQCNRSHPALGRSEGRRNPQA